MTVTATPIFPQTVKNYAAQILPADTSTKKTLCAGGTNGTKIEAIMLASTDSTARDIQFWLNNGSIDLLLCTISAIINSGNTNAIPAIDVLRHSQFPGTSYDSNGNRILYISNGWTLKVASTTTVAAAKEVDIVAMAGDY